MWLAVLGPLNIWSEDAEVAIPAAKQRAVLAALLVRANQVVSFGELAENVWDGAPPPTARVTLRNYVKCLRRLLGPADGARIITRDPGYLLRVREDEADLLRFGSLSRQGAEAMQAADWPQAAGILAQALALWRGEPLADIPSDTLRRDAAPRLEQLRLQTLEWRVDADLNLGRHADLVLELQALAAEQPLRERFHAQLMLALYRCGRPAEALAAYDQARKLLVGQLGVEPGPELRDLHMRILRADEDLAVGKITASPAGPGRLPGPAGAGEAAAVVPRQLPASARHFAGRVRELDTLTAVADSTDSTDGAAGVVAVCAVNGPAGVGKTTLAIRFAHQVAGRFPDGQLYVNLRGFGPAGPPVSPAEAIGGFLGALGVEPMRIPSDLPGQAALYRSLLAGRRVLIVLDNARDSSQVRPLLPGSHGCLVIVTSRSQLVSMLAVEGAHPVPLDLFTISESRELLARHLGAGRIAAEPGAAEDIARLCARLPLALSVAAARAGSRPRLPLAATAAELRSAASRLDALGDGDPLTDSRTVFSWSYLQLEARAARVFRLLGLHPGPDISVSAVASMAGVPRDEAHRILDELTGVHLVAESAPGRFTLHDLTRAYAAELAWSHDDVRAGARRYLDHYLQSAYAADRILAAARDAITLPPAAARVVPEEAADARQAQAWFLAEHQVLLTAAKQAAELGFDEHAWQIPWTLVTFLDRQGHWRDWESSQQDALAAASRAGDVTGQAHSYRQLGRLLIRQGPYAEAESPLTAALDCFRQAGDPVGEARVRLDIAQAMERQRRYRDAITHSMEALTLFRATGHQAGQSRALNGIGWCHACLGEAELALPYCEQALSLDRAQENLQAVSSSLHSVGYIHQIRGDHRQAVTCYTEALDLSCRLGDRYGEADSQASLGDTYHAMGNLPRARSSWQHSLVILDELRHPEASAIRSRLGNAEAPAGARTG